MILPIDNIDNICYNNAIRKRTKQVTRKALDMKSLISKDGKWMAERISNYDVQVSNVKTFTSYIIMANVKTGTTGRCQCAYGKRAGTECPHVALVKEFVAAEQAPIVEVKPTSTLQTWLKSQEDDGIILFA